MLDTQVVVLDESVQKQNSSGSGHPFKHNTNLDGGGPERLPILTGVAQKGYLYYYFKENAISC